ncbi:MAG: GHKL domain-containing protein [Flavobacteriales bacterium]|nr:GHKL domain-containing protein [Flavobacteriales bacterium]
MRPFTILLFSASLCVAKSDACGQVIIHGAGVVGPVGGAARYFADTTGTLQAGELPSEFGALEQSTAIPRFALSKTAHWLRFGVSNESDRRMVSIGIPYAAIDELDVYLHREGAYEQIARSGLARMDGDTMRSQGEYAFPLPLEPGEKAEVVVRMRSFKPIHAAMMLGTSAAIERLVTARYPAIGAYVGIMLVLALYNFFIFLSTRDRNYFLYVLSTVTVCAAQLSLQGYGPFDLVAQSEWLTPRASLLFSLVAIPLGFEFAKGFINTRAYTPVLHRLTPIVYLVLGAIAVLFMFGDPWVGYKVGQMASGMSAMYLLAMSIVAVRRGSRQARFFLLAWSGFLIGVVLFVLKDEGVLPYNTWTIYAMPVGSVIEGVLLSFGLADRINILRKEKEQSQAQALASAQENARITRDQNVILEQKVTERTEQLQQSLDQLKQAQSQLVEAEKMSSLGQLTAGIAHEINNPINYIRSNIPPLKRDMADLLEVLGAYRAHGAPQQVAALEQQLGLDETIKEVGDILHSMEEGANRTAEIVRGLRSFSRLDEGDLKSVDVNDGIRSTLNILGPQLKDRVQVELQLNALEVLECFPGKLNQVFMNMLNNATQAVIARHGEQGGLIRVISEQAEGHTVISILDNGIGMKPEVRARVFEPFFTTKAVGEGTGLGLSIAHSIIEKHNGRIEVDSVENEGSMFRIILPNTQPMAVAKRA